MPPLQNSQTIAHQRLHIQIQGVVQGVGFRPFVYRLATDLGLVGWVNNTPQGVVVEVEGGRSQLDTFLRRIESDKPPQSCIYRLDANWMAVRGDPTFEIHASRGGAAAESDEKTAIVLPDLATCPDCLKDVFDSTNPRYRYPFTNCTNCGARFSIIESLPYDRPNTTMQSFRMCAQCQAEYEQPLNRRFHAQPNACPLCGPHLEWWDRSGQVLASHDRALEMAVEALRQGQIIAVKGLGGFHFWVDARCEAAIQRLRQAKQRPDKPFALMYPTLESIQAHCEVSALEAQWLRSPEAPIVLLRRKPGRQNDAGSSPDLEPCPSPAVAPGNPDWGVMLPYTPLHHLLIAALGNPVVATSGNLSSEPICTDEHEALKRFRNIVDGFLIHNRLIARPIDDSLVREMSGQQVILRRSRGYVPLPIPVHFSSKLVISSSALSSSISHAKILAVGAQLKNTIAFLYHQQVFISQHIGDLETASTFQAFQQTIARFQHLYDLHPTAIACDLHPDYGSTQYAHQLAAQWAVPLIPVQHHYAHSLACMAEHQLRGATLGIAWDGAGYGLDGTIWGGEFLQMTEDAFQRVACLRPFPLPGGEKAMREPRRSALGLLYEGWGEGALEWHDLAPIQAFTQRELSILKTMLHQTCNTPRTSSAGRLFDAISSLLNLCHHASFEGQAAMKLEWVMTPLATNEHYPFEVLEPSAPGLPAIVDWVVMLHHVLADYRSGCAPEIVSAKVHNTLVEMMVAIVQRCGVAQIVLTGGCFQNRYLTERAVQRLKEAGFCPYWHRQVPPNDGGIALGQIMAALRQ